MPTSQSTTLPVEFAVAGENKANSELLLLLGDDGNYYAFSLADGHTDFVEPDDQWTLESTLVHDSFG